MQTIYLLWVWYPTLKQWGLAAEQWTSHAAVEAAIAGRQGQINADPRTAYHITAITLPDPEVPTETAHV